MAYFQHVNCTRYILPFYHIGNRTQKGNTGPRQYRKSPGQTPNLISVSDVNTLDIRTLLSLGLVFSLLGALLSRYPKALVFFNTFVFPRQFRIQLFFNIHIYKTLEVFLGAKFYCPFLLISKAMCLQLLSSAAFWLWNMAPLFKYIFTNFLSLTACLTVLDLAL